MNYLVENTVCVVEILRKSFEDSIEIKRKQSLGFLVVEPENI